MSFTALPTTVCPGAPVTFTSTTTGGVPGPVTTLWDFGDGDTCGGTPTSHSYAATGTYNITLFATNSDGCQAELTDTWALILWSLRLWRHFPEALPIFATRPAPSLLLIHLKAGAIDLLLEFRRWQRVVHSHRPDTYVHCHRRLYPTLIVTSAAGCSDTVTYSDYIVINTLTASFTSPSTACLISVI